MLNFQSMITILKDKGEMETRGSPLQLYIKIKVTNLLSNNIQQWRRGGRRYRLANLNL